MTTDTRAAQWWTTAPAYQASFLDGADPELLAIALDPLPPDAPAVVRYRPTAHGSLAEHVEDLLSGLDEAARGLFPRWLPGADRFDGSTTLGVPAARAMAQRMAIRGPQFGPFLTDLAERSVRPRMPAAFPAEVRAACLARVIADAYTRSAAALLISVSPGLTEADEHAFAGAAEWLAERGRFTVWLAGSPLATVDRLRRVSVRLPDRVRELADVPTEPGPPDEGPAVWVPPLAGTPHPGSAAEQALERALAACEWAGGRAWNQNYHSSDLAREYRLDLLFARERVVVEVDGPDHLRPVKAADDRARDVDLQVHGYAVLRFTNEQVLDDAQLVIHKIQQILRSRASARIPEMRHHAD